MRDGPALWDAWAPSGHWGIGANGGNPGISYCHCHHRADLEPAWLLNLHARAVNLTVGANLRLGGYPNLAGEETGSMDQICQINGGCYNSGMR